MTVSVPSTANAGKFTHPKGLMTLFFTEMWERASYYGMRALLVLFLASPVAAGGLGFDDKNATAIYGVYTACIYLSSLPGGWIADRLLGMQRSVFWGGVIIALGHFSMALPWVETFFLGLVLIVLGTGLLKPCISTLVGELYKDDISARRDAGFSIYYMGINLGAILGPLICGYFGENINWHYGFAASGIGMVAGLIQFHFSRHKLEGAGAYTLPAASDHAAHARNRRAWWIVGILTGAFLTYVGMAMAGTVTVDPVYFATNGSIVIAVSGLLYFLSIYFRTVTPMEKDRMKAAGVLFLFSAIFWCGFEQAGSSFNLFGARYTDRVFGNWEMPASWLQAVNSTFVVTLAPFFAALWIWLGQRNLNPSSPLKFALALVQLGLGFGVIAWAAEYVLQGEMVLPTWLVLTYLLHTTAELCLSPISLSMTTKLAPKGYSAQVMATYFISISLGNLFAGILAGHLSGDALPQMPTLFTQVMLFCFGGAVLLYAIKDPIRRWMHGVL